MPVPKIEAEFDSDDLNNFGGTNFRDFDYDESNDKINRVKNWSFCRK